MPRIVQIAQPSALDYLRRRAPFVDHRQALSMVASVSAGGALNPLDEVQPLQSVTKSELLALRKNLAELALEETPSGFVDHHAAFALLYGVSATGIGNPMTGMSAFAFNQEDGTDTAEEAAAVDVAGTPQRIGFSEFAALVNHPLDLLASDAESYLECHATYNYEGCCGLDHMTGEVYFPSVSVSDPELDFPSDVTPHVWQAVSRPYRIWIWNSLGGGSSFIMVPSLHEILGFCLRRLALA